MADVWSHAFDEEEQAAERQARPPQLCAQLPARHPCCALRAVAHAPCAPPQFASQNDATAFLIDAGPAMLRPHTVATEEEEDAVFGNALSFLGLAIRLVEQLMRSKCVAPRPAPARAAARAAAAAGCAAAWR